jgi:hypothetical protein
MQLLQGMMRDYFRDRRRECPEDRVYGLNRLTTGMLGKYSRPTLKAKAGETRSMLGFVVDAVLTPHQAALGDKVGQASMHAARVFLLATCQDTRDPNTVG